MSVRVRCAPSPTGPLHIGGARTALFNYLFAKHHNGEFIIRIEDTDQARTVPGAEAYILESLAWLGLTATEGPEQGGPHSPYRQSDRKDLYLEYAHQLINNGWAYYAFDTPDELEGMRARYASVGDVAQKYDASVRIRMRNSISLDPELVKEMLERKIPYTIRLKVPEHETITFVDQIRDEVSFASAELDDKVLIKTDGMPTYHLANIVDDHLMRITHVIRGEEWLPSTAHHVLLYRAFGWEDTIPQFAHLPLILKPSGQGKLSKRDGAKFGFPVFPLEWHDPSGEISAGFREMGFLPGALINFLALLGWNPGTEQEIFDLNGLGAAFSLEQVSRSGARFDYDKALWFNQQYILATEPEILAELAKPVFEANGIDAGQMALVNICNAYRERIKLLPDLVTESKYLFGEIEAYDQDTITKKWTADFAPHFIEIGNILSGIVDFTETHLKAPIMDYIKSNTLKMGVIFPLLRIAISGSPSGPEVFVMLELLGKAKAVERIGGCPDVFDALLNN
jgi:glutamyl-tRNA synthetase